jgi:hypothetical protein
MVNPDPVTKRPWPFYRPAVLWGSAATVLILVLGLASGRSFWLVLGSSLGSGFVVALWWFRVLTLDERVHKPRKIDLP